MTAIQQARYDALLRRVADLKGQGSMVHDALGELFPVIDVENVPGELLLLQGTTLGMTGHQIAAIAGETPKIQLFNPVGSGKIVTITTVAASAAGVAVFEFFLTTTPLGEGIGNNAVRDTRRAPGSVTTAEITAVSSVGGIPTFFIFRALANTPQYISDPNGVAILAPGTGLTVAPEGSNIALYVSFFFRERVAEPSELNF